MKIHKNNIRATIITSVILIIPFFYVLFFLKAFWDPYTNMKNVPVAVVNLDDGKIGKEIVKNLKANNIMDLKLVPTDSEAAEGVKDRKYYSSFTIPKDFTSDLEHLKKTEITYRSNKKFNFIASQIYERVAIEVQHTVKENIGVEVVKKLHSGIGESADKIALLNDGLRQLDEGSTKLLNGVKTLDSKYTEFNSGMNTLNSGVKKLNEGSKQYVDGVNKAVSGLDKIAGGVIQLGNTVPILKMSKDFQKLYAGAKMVKTEEIKKQINDGGAKLREGITTLNNGSSRLNKASGLVKGALGQIEEGSAKLNNGISTAHNAVNKSSENANEKTEELKKLDEFVENSVSLKEINIDNVDKYGTVFAAYFMSISLWVGSLVLIVVMYYDAKKRFGVFDRNYANKTKQYLLYLGLIAIQAPLLSVLVTSAFHFKLLNFPVLIVSMMVTDLAFFSMVYCFVTLFDDFGKFISVILLIVQISSSAGTFPIETAPKLFVDIFPVIPMKYSVNIFKEAFGGFDPRFFKPNFIFLLGTFILFSAISLITIRIKKVLAEKKIVKNAVKIIEEK